MIWPGALYYGSVLKGVAGVLEKEEFGLLETEVQRVEEHVPSGFPAVREAAGRITKLRIPRSHAVSGISVEATFGR